MLLKCCTQYFSKFGKITVATGLEKISSHFCSKEEQCQEWFKLPYNCTHFTCKQGNTQNPSTNPCCCSMSGSNCCFLRCIQVSWEAGQVVWYFHLMKNFPQFVVIHTVKGFSVVNKAEVDFFLKLSYFFYDAMENGNLISGSSAFF